MKRILAFGGSTSQNSINKQLASFAISRLVGLENVIIDLNDYEMPIFSLDREKELGIPEAAHSFKQQIVKANGIIMSLAEHNGSYSSAYKNIYDWVSRIPGNMWEDKPIFLMATSPGARGGKSVLEAASTRMPFQGGKVVATFSLPFFSENFHERRGIINPQLSEEFSEQLSLFTEAI
jgi:NAD(P)H-dependent FMN reductase